MKRTIVNFACPGREKYLLGQQRLHESLLTENRKGEGVDLLFFTNEYPPWSPTHQDSPYAFKYFAMQEAIRRGAEQVLWLDASIVALKSLGPIWNAMDAHGVVLFDNPNQPQSVWTTDACAAFFGTQPKDLDRMCQVCGGVVGVDWYSEPGNRTLGWMMQCERAGIFKPGLGSHPQFKEHRHDQSCLTFLTYYLNLERLPMDWLRYSYDKRGLKEAILEVRGME